MKLAGILGGMKRFLASLILMAVVVLGASSCGDDPTPTPTRSAPADPTPAAASPRPLNVITTVSPITSIVENIGGARIRLEGIVPEGTNSHTFSPAPSVARLMAEADLIVMNGLFLEEPSLEMAKANKKPGTVILALADKAITGSSGYSTSPFPRLTAIQTPTCGRTPSWR